MMKPGRLQKEVRVVLKELKKNEALGEDGISAELLKSPGLVKEEMSVDWKIDLIIPVFQKKESKKCDKD